MHRRRGYMDLLMEYIVKEKYVDPYMMPAQFVGAV
jgi:hypothetical protein